MAKNKFNHTEKIKNLHPGKLLSIIPGMIITFRYLGPQITDKQPLILYLHYDSVNGLVDGLNLNYLDNFRFKKLFEGFQNITQVTTQNKSTSNLISENYTLISIPPLGKLQTKSRAETIVEMRRLYKQFINKTPGFTDIYRSYKPSNLSSLKIVNLKDY